MTTDGQSKPTSTGTTLEADDIGAREASKAILCRPPPHLRLISHCKVGSLNSGKASLYHSTTYTV
ncbi:hypothetical protein KIN20_016455 [Parelaphostrongylus tenuis]|uniref:Uncharacterized protein n=1 Tax=Parelaphostrongylus tenuis TaxID=148309 RepID=A0AAD5QPT2_PARTN|nr:hypothetical protein KIN20_016455 [Parelaphostrongylus tenuis]